LALYQVGAVLLICAQDEPLRWVGCKNHDSPEASGCGWKSAVAFGG